MNRTTLPLHRRTRVERRILAILRGGGDIRVSPDQADAFAGLRRCAAANHLVIAPPDAPYVGVDELKIMSWLADAQRRVSKVGGPADAALAQIVRRCAGLLNGMGLRLSPLVLYNGQGDRPFRRFPVAR